MRHSPSHHLGLGDIRITIAQQEAILEAIKGDTTNEPKSAETCSAASSALPTHPSETIPSGVVRDAAQNNDGGFLDLTGTNNQAAASRRGPSRDWQNCVRCGAAILNNHPDAAPSQSECICPKCGIRHGGGSGDGSF